MDTDNYLSAADAAKMAGVTPQMLYKLVKTGNATGHLFVNGHHYFRLGDMLRYREERVREILNKLRIMGYNSVSLGESSVSPEDFITMNIA